MFYFFRGAIVTLLLIINMLLSASMIFITAGFASLLKKKPLQKFLFSQAFKLQVLWTQFNKWILNFSSKGKWDILGTGTLNPKSSYILISNHCSWSDVIVLGNVFNRKIPLLKFFMKKSLLWQLPLAGIDCYLLGYPIMTRYSRKEIRKNRELKGKDIDSTKKACQKCKNFPTTLINFTEGTRFTKEKQQRQISPYDHLLKPKAAGIALVIKEMQDELGGIINVTLHYDAENKKIWNFLCGKFNKIYIRYEVIPITDDIVGDYYTDRIYRKKFQRWLNDIWQKKDLIINNFKNDNVQTKKY